MLRQTFKKIVVALLTLEARAVLQKYKPKIVAITGSVGKTSAKDAIFSVLAQKYFVRKSEKSFNSEVGLPLTILGVPNGWNNPLRWTQNLFDGLFLIIMPARYPEWLVLEIGADRPGDIRSAAKWLQTDVVVITRLPEVPVHVEYFNSPDEVIEEKASLIKSLKKDGVLVLYGDDKSLLALAARAGRAITFGFSDSADVRGNKPEILPGIGMKAEIIFNDISHPVEVVGAAGAHSLYPILAAAAVGRALRISPQEIVRGLGSYAPPPGRMRLLQGIKETTIIDDSYNSSPAAALAALDTLQGDALKSHGVKASPLRRVAVLGDMLELGKYSAEEHRKVGKRAAKACDLLFTVGFRARHIAEGALDEGMSESKIFQYEDSRVAGAELKNILQTGDIVLVKGSQGMRTEKVVEEIMLEPERAEKLLVRQNAEWKKR